MYSYKIQLFSLFRFDFVLYSVIPAYKRPMGFNNVRREQNRFMTQIHMKVLGHPEIIPLFDCQSPGIFFRMKDPLLVDITQCFRQANNFDDIIKDIIVAAVFSGERIPVHL